jgi:hypothetical protein
VNLSREEQLILCCARTQLSANDHARFHELLRGPLNWPRVAEIARLHRLCPLLFKHFKAEGKFELMPAEYAARIQRQAVFTIGRNLAQTNELARILKLFRDAGFEAIPFKGPVLALRAYGNLGLREFYDLDFLLRRGDLLKAKKVLFDQGYTSPWKQNEQWEQAHIDTQLGCDFTSADGKTRIELHWSFIQKWLTYDVDLDAIWRRAVTWQFAGTPMRMVAREDLLPYLCAHGAKHHWERLFWIIDIAEIVRVERDLNWGSLIEQSRLHGNWRVLALGLHLAKTLLDAPLPEHVWSSIEKETAIAELAAQVGTWLFHEEKRVVSGDWNETKFYLGVKERFSDRAAYSKHLLKLTLAPSHADRTFVKLPPSLDFLYPAVRPIRWAAKKFGG